MKSSIYWWGDCIRRAIHSSAAYTIYLVSKEVHQDTVTLPPLFPNALMKHLHSCIPPASLLTEQIAGWQAEFRLYRFTIVSSLQVTIVSRLCLPPPRLAQWYPSIWRPEHQHHSTSEEYALTVLERSEYSTSFLVPNKSLHGTQLWYYFSPDVRFKDFFIYITVQYVRITAMSNLPEFRIWGSGRQSDEDKFCNSEFDLSSSVLIHIWHPSARRFADFQLGNDNDDDLIKVFKISRSDWDMLFIVLEDLPLSKLSGRNKVWMYL